MNNLIYVMKKHNTKKVLCFFLATEIAEKCKKYGGGGVTENVSKWLKNAQKMSDPLTEGAFCSIIETLLNFGIY